MSRKKNIQNNRKRGKKTLFTVVSLAAALGLVIGVIISDPPFKNTPNFSGDTGGFAGHSSALAQEVISMVGCACGCGLRLEECHCDSPNGSVEMKGFINELAGKNMDKKEILRRVKKRFKI